MPALAANDQPRTVHQAQGQESDRSEPSWALQSSDFYQHLLFHSEFLSLPETPSSSVLLLHDQANGRGVTSLHIASQVLPGDCSCAEGSGHLVEARAAPRTTRWASEIRPIVRRRRSIHLLAPVRRLSFPQTFLSEEVDQEFLQQSPFHRVAPRQVQRNRWRSVIRKSLPVRLSAKASGCKPLES